MEYRHIASSDARLTSRATSNGAAVLEGYAAVWNSDSLVIGNDLSGFIEVIRPGAFSRSIRENDVRALHSHSSDVVLGRTGSGTLTLAEDSRGLRFQVVLVDSELINGLVIQPIRRQDISGMSFGFNVRKGGESWSLREGRDIRYLTDIALLEISTVAFPAYPATSVELVGSQRQASHTPMTRAASGRITTPAQLNRFLLGRQQKYLAMIGGR